MIIKLNLPSNDDPALLNSPILKAAELTIEFIEEFGPIELTNLKAFKRYFVTWAAQNFDWPYYGYDELMVANKVLNEADFLPLEMLHFILLGTKIGRHYKGAFHVTALGKKLKRDPAKLWQTLADFLIFKINHSYTTRTHQGVLGNWDIFFNVINVEARQGMTTTEICYALYGEPETAPNAHEIYYAFYFNVLRPLCWAGLLTEVRAEKLSLPNRLFVKSTLWQATLKLDTDDYLTETISQ